MRQPDVRYAGAVNAEDGQSQPVYVSVEPHVCNLYCRPGRHAELLYREDGGPFTLADAQAVADIALPGRQVLDVQPAPEAPLPDGFRSAWLVSYGQLQRDRTAAELEARR